MEHSQDKKRLPLIVPLAHQAIPLLEQLQPLTGRFEYVLTGKRAHERKHGQWHPQGARIRRADDSPWIQGHGVERLGYAENIVEMQLGHKVPDVHGRAYNRAQWIEERQAMMQRWADYLDELKQT